MAVLLLLFLLQSAPAIDVRAADPGPRAFAPSAPPVDLGEDPRLAFGSGESFTVELALRTTHADFATVLMCREGEAVAYSLVLGRNPGLLSGELWSWQQDRAMTTRRVDDGRWHDVRLGYHAPAHTLGLWLDGTLESWVEIRADSARPPRPRLRLGNNIGCDQPFQGELARVQVRAGLAAAVRVELEQCLALRVLPPGQAAAAMERWLGRLRAPRDPDPGRAGEARRIQAQVQDALGLWPPPYAPREQRVPAWPSPLAHGDGPLPGATDFRRFRPTLPLDVRTGGSLARDGYTVTRVDWQVCLGHRGRGYLYLPTTPAAGRRAAVLCPHGHWDTGNRHAVVQARCITLARLGYVVLTPDADHVDDDAIGLGSAGLMAWTNLRGLELLRARPDVDPERIGCTGASGGGLQTMHLMSLDAGLAAAVPAVMACYFDEILRAETVHCRCNFTPRLFAVGDQPQMCSAFAPRPVLFLSVTGDWTHAFPTRGYPPLRQLWDGAGGKDAIAVRQWEGGHDYSRPMRNAMYAFFEHWLHQVAAPAAELEPSEPAPEPPAALAQLERPDVNVDLAAVRTEFRARLQAPPMTADAAVLAAGRQRLAQLFDPPAAPAAVRVHTRRPVTALGLTLEAVTVVDPREPEIHVPVLVARPARAARGWTVVVGAGKESVLRQQRPWLDALLDHDRAVVLADIRYSGELDQGRLWREPYGRFFGQDEGVVAVHDLRTVLDALPLLDAAVPAEIELLAFGSQGAPALFAAALDPRVLRVLAPDLGPTYAAAERAPRLARVLRHGDLPAAAALLAPRALLAGGVPDVSVYDDARRCHGAGATRSLRLQAAPLTVADLFR